MTDYSCERWRNSLDDDTPRGWEKILTRWVTPTLKLGVMLTIIYFCFQ